MIQYKNLVALQGSLAYIQRNYDVIPLGNSSMLPGIIYHFLLRQIVLLN